MLNEGEFLKILDRMNINQILKVIPALYKDKLYCCICHHAYRKSFEDS